MLLLKITFIKELKMEFFVVFTKFYFLKKLFFTFSSALHSTGPATIPAINQIKTPKTKPPTALQADPPKKLFFTGSCKAKQCSIDAWHQKPRITFLGWFSPPPSTDASQLPPCAERFSTAKCSSVLERGAHCCGAH